MSAFIPKHRGAPAQSGRPQKRSSEPREICGTGGEKKVKSGSRNSSGLPPPPEPGSTLPSAGWSTTCLQGPVCLASSSIRAAYIHVSAEEPPSPDEPAATTHLQTEGGDKKKKKKDLTLLHRVARRVFYCPTVGTLKCSSSFHQERNIFNQYTNTYI